MKRKVLLIEINEITWDLIDPFIAEGKLPTFAYLKKNGTWASPTSVDLPPQLDPWITWTTVYTGRTQAEHNVFYLQQPPDTIRAKRIWELCKDAGLKVGVYGSLGSYPPQQVDGFYVPDTFSPDYATFPQNLSPIQKLNLTYTRSIRLENDSDGLMFKAKLGTDLLKLGLSVKTCTKIVKQLATEKISPQKRWQRVVLQPAVNFDFFSKLYRQHQPDFACFHTNHVAHYQHTYWNAMSPELFPQKTSADEQNIYGKAIEFGYRSADELLKKALTLCDNETILVVASSMGQKPFISDLKNGKSIGQMRSLDRLMEIIGVKDETEAISVMSDQFNIYPKTAEAKQKVIKNLTSAYIDNPSMPMFFISELEEFITVNLNNYDEITDHSNCVFPTQPGNNSFVYEDLVYQTGLSKSGCHDPKGMMIVYGNGVRSAEQINQANNLDIAPTLMKILDLPIPTEMKGRVLNEIFT